MNRTAFSKFSILTLGLFLSFSIAFAQLIQSKPETITSGTLTVTVTPINPCDGGSNGSIKFDMTSTNGPISIFAIGTGSLGSYSSGSSFTWNGGPFGAFSATPALSGSLSYTFFINNTSNSLLPSVPLTSLSTISLSTDPATNLINGSCTAPNGQIVSTISGGSASGPGLTGGGSFQYTFKKAGVTVSAGILTSPYHLTFSNLSGGNYTLDASDSYSSCVLPTASWTITDPVISIATSQTNPLCNGAATGAGTFTASGGTSPYTFTITSNTTGGTTSTTPTTLNLTGAAAGSIAIQATDANGCSSISTITITQPAALSLSKTADVALSCFGDKTGTGTFTASGGTAPYTFLVTSNTTGGTTSFTATTLDLTGGGVGSIAVQVTDSKGCTSTATIVITQPASALTLSKTADVALSCFGDKTGTGTFTASGGTAPYTFSVTSNTTTGTTSFTATTLDLTGGGVGSITVQVTDSKGCTSTATIGITQPASALTLGKTADVALSCFGDKTGTGTFTASGGTAPYTFSVTSNTTTGATSFTATTLGLTGGGVGSITVQVTDSKGCTSTATIVITQPASALTLSKTADQVLCFGAANGTGTFTASGGTAPYTFLVTSNTTGGTTSSTATTLDLTGGGVGSITVQVTDSKGCTSTATIGITQAASALSLGKTADVALSCFGDKTGTGTFTASGGTAPYTFSITSNTTGGTTPINSTTVGLVGGGLGSITVQVTDSKGCTGTATISITQPASALTLSKTADQVLCFGAANGTGTFTASGGTAPYTFSVTSNTTGGTTNVNATTVSLVGAGGGVIAIQVSDSKGCTTTNALTITLLPTTDPRCSGACPTLTTSNTTVCPSGGTVDLTTLVSASVSGGSYTFTGTGVSGSIFDPSASAGMALAIGVTYVKAGCPDATGTINATVLLASNPRCGASGTCATVIVTPTPSPATCTISNGAINFNITPATPAVNNIGVVIDLTGTSPTNLTISRTQKNSFNFTALPSGVYSFSIQYGDAACTLTGKVTVDQSGTIGTPAASNIIAPSCFGQASGSVNIDVPGQTGNVLQWSLDGGISDPFKSFTAGSQVTGIPAGQQIISVRKDSSDPCFAAVTITVPNGPADIATSATVTNATCANTDGSILFSAITGGTAPYTYQFDAVTIATLPANNTFTGLAAGTHTLSVLDKNGCSKDFSSNISFPGLVNFSVSGINSSCVSLANGSVTAKILSVGAYKVGVSTSQSTQPSNFFDVTSDGTTTFKFDKLTGGSYFVFVKSVGSQCQNITQQDISNAVSDLVISYSTGAACIGTSGSISINSIGGGNSTSYAYSLDGVSFLSLPSNNTFTGLAGGDHIFRVIDAGSCSKDFTITIPVPTVIDFNLISNPLKCIEDAPTVVLSGLKGAGVDYTYQVVQQATVFASGTITTVNAKADFTIPNLSLVQGNYQIQLQQNQSSINGCATPISVAKPFTIVGPNEKLDTLYVLKQISLPDFATGSAAVGIKESGKDPYEVRVELTQPLFATQGYLQDWTRAARNAQNLKLEVTAKNLFAGKYQVSLRDGFGCLKNYTFSIKADESIFIPNVITPNGDGFNDTFFIRNLPPSSQVIILNRWGVEVYNSSDYKNDWDAKATTEGVYFYRIKAADQVFTGWLEILRDNK